jgi:hypothetical protein
MDSSTSLLSESLVGHSMIYLAQKVSLVHFTSQIRILIRNSIKSNTKIILGSLFDHVSKVILICSLIGSSKPTLCIALVMLMNKPNQKKICSFLIFGMVYLQHIPVMIE